MKNLLLSLFLILSISSSLFSQAVFTSSCGYSITVYIKPINIIEQAVNSGNYGYEVQYHYDVVIGGIPTCGNNSLYNFQTYITCSKTGKTSGSYTDLPKNLINSSGFLQTTNNQQANQTGILPSEATVENFLCNDIKVTISGPGLPSQTKSLNPGALPIELLYFDAIANNNQVDLSWITGSEKNNDFFTIERTVDGVAYEEVVKVPGQGNSSTKIDYHYTDLRPVTGVSFYRLKQTDFNGESECFDVKSVNVERQGLVSNVYPNPTVFNKTTVFIAQTNANVTLNVRNILGQILFSKEVDSKSKDVYEEIEFTEAGKLFIVEVVQNDAIIARHKVIKN